MLKFGFWGWVWLGWERMSWVHMFVLFEVCRRILFSLGMDIGRLESCFCEWGSGLEVVELIVMRGWR